MPFEMKTFLFEKAIQRFAIQKKSQQVQGISETQFCILKSICYRLTIALIVYN
jgi:hypothetical protein